MQVETAIAASAYVEVEQAATVCGQLDAAREGGPRLVVIEIGVLPVGIITDQREVDGCFARCEALPASDLKDDLPDPLKFRFSAGGFTDGRDVS